MSDVSFNTCGSGAAISGMDMKKCRPVALLPFCHAIVQDAGGAPAAPPPPQEGNIRIAPGSHTQHFLGREVDFSSEEPFWVPDLTPAAKSGD